MLSRQIRTALLLSTLLALAAITGVLAKDNAVVTFDSTLPADPQPGSEFTLGWTVETRVDGGGTAPFNAEGVFVRLIPSTGEPVEALGVQDSPGHYVATLTVPTGGIGEVEVGVRGEQCANGTCSRSDMMFVIDKSATQGLALPAQSVADPANGSATATTTVDAGSGIQPVGILALALALVAGTIAVGLVVMRARGRALTPRSSRS